MVLTTARLKIRDVEEGDFLALREQDSDPAVQQYRGARTISEEQTRRNLQRCIAAAQEQPRQQYVCAVTSCTDEQLVGLAFLMGVDLEVREAEIGYSMTQRFWGQGYATETAAGLLAFSFETLGLHRVWAKCIAENIRSWHVLEKIGMRREGHLRECEWVAGRWQDHLLYGILDHEWITKDQSKQ